MTLSRKDIEALYTRYGPMVLRRCRRLLGQEERAMEAMQDVFVNVLKSADILTNENPSSLLYQVATNVCLNLIRTKKRRPETESGEVIEQIAAATDIEKSVSLMNYFEKIFKGQPASTAYMAILHFVDEMTLEEVAEEVGMSVSGVRKRLRLLKEYVNNLGDKK